MLIEIISKKEREKDRIFFKIIEKEESKKYIKQKNICPSPLSLYDNACIKEETMYYVYDLEIISSTVLLSILNISDEKTKVIDISKSQLQLLYLILLLSNEIFNIIISILTLN